MTDKDAIRRHLSETRQGLLELLGPLTKAEWETILHEKPEPWTVADMLRHLATAEQGMSDLIAHIRDGGPGASADFDLNRWNHSRVRKARSAMPAELLARMEEERRKLLEMLDQMRTQDLARRGRHGSGRDLSIAEIFQLVGDHEHQHCRQISAHLEKREGL